MIKKKILFKFFILLTSFLYLNNAYAEVTFKNFENKKVPYLNFFLLKFENKLINRSKILSRQIFATRVQYSNIGTSINYDEKKKKFLIKIYAKMDKLRYQKKKYIPKISDCNQIRNLIFYGKHGYKLLNQKRDPTLSVDIMEDTFKNIFLSKDDLSKEEIDFLMKKIFIHVTVFQPIIKSEISCSGKINEYELK